MLKRACENARSPAQGRTHHERREDTCHGSNQFMRESIMPPRAWETDTLTRAFWLHPPSTTRRSLSHLNHNMAPPPRGHLLPTCKARRGAIQFMILGLSRFVVWEHPDWGIIRSMMRDDSGSGFEILAHTGGTVHTYGWGFLPHLPV